METVQENTHELTYFVEGILQGTKVRGTVGLEETGGPFFRGDGHLYFLTDIPSSSVKVVMGQNTVLAQVVPL